MRKFAAQRYNYPNLKTIVSIGGWSGSRGFSAIAASASITQTFVKNVHAFLDSEGFDGVDLDWEYPGGGGITCNTVSDSDATNMVNLVAALRAELGPDRSISLAVSAEVSHYVDKVTKVQQIPNIMKYVSYVQIMSYDFYGSWDAYSDFVSPSDPTQPASNNVGYSQSLSQAVAVNEWVAAGASKSQLTNGLAFYGRSWSVQSNTNNGLYQLCTGSVNGAACPGVVGDYLDVTQWCDPCNVCYNSGVWMYLNMRGAGSQTAAPLASGPTTASNGWSRQYFDFAQSPTLYTASYRGQSSFISYDDPVSIQAKAAFAKSAGLGGTMIWELSQDYNKELTNAARAGWGV
ncbi:glycoside hydrolase [Rhizoclosmatium globosum]|uniref:Glycoside hydrolase n=1 Tax=Rhizoclosmatium globosum TaxID=329046 RepID=A0A1Y2CAT0_9FUNG|nr:glycoside hydrolase [Rhizoclosmatium globosum]|eukprot:ORY44142.1 glycoside hydrolase [Rhizoclosmatium globosum]